MIQNAETKLEALSSDKLVGWIGAGKMGAPMIRNLLSAGASVAVADPSENALAEMVSFGAVQVNSLEDFSQASIVFSTLPTDKVLLDVVLGTASTKGIAHILPANSVFVEMSTVSPDCSEKVAKALHDADIHYLRAPISGSTALAQTGDLTIFASGDEAAWAASLPYLAATSTKQFFLGPEDQARYMKLVVNALVGATSAILAEALSLGVSGGLTRENIMEVLCQSAVASPLLAYKKETVVAGDFDPAFTVEQMIKDFTLIADAARDKNVPLFANGLILEQYRAAANAGLRQKDFFALVKWHEDLSKSKG